MEPFGGDPASGLEVGDDGILGLEVDEGVAGGFGGGGDEIDGAVGPVAEHIGRLVDEVGLGEAGASDAVEGAARRLDGGPAEQPPLEQRFDGGIHPNRPHPHHAEQKPDWEEREKERVEQGDGEADGQANRKVLQKST